MREKKTITKTLTDDSEYMRMLKFCMEHGLSCFEYHYRHRKADRRMKKGGAA